MAISSRAAATEVDAPSGARGLVARFASDWQWWVALALGPVFWLGLHWFAGGAGDARWVLQAPLDYLKLALLLPLLEEAVFRGALQGWLLQQPWGKRRRCGISAANLLTSIAFSAAHVLNHTPLWAAAVLGPSLVFGYFRERHASLLPAVLLHVAYNAGYFLWFSEAALAMRAAGALAYN